MIKNPSKKLSIFNLDNFNFYYGIPNSYSNFSIGTTNPYDAFRISYNNKLDFLFLTDLNENLSSVIKYNKHKKSKWILLNDLSKKFSKRKENFIGLAGFEAKSTSLGDFVVMNSKTYFTGTIKNINFLLLWLLNNENAFLFITNPNKTLSNMKYNELLDKIFCSFCVCSYSHNKYIRREKFYYSLLDKGWKLGAINSQANIKDDFGKSSNLTGVVINKFNKDKLSNAFICRKTFSTESSSLKLFFTTNEYSMGDIIYNPTDYLDFNILCEDKYLLINKIQIISNKGQIIKEIDNINLHKIKYLYRHQIETSQTWFLIKLFQDNDKISISSPVFLKK